MLREPEAGDRAAFIELLAPGRVTSLSARWRLTGAAAFSPSISTEP
jgi:hypothetical protein